MTNQLAFEFRFWVILFVRGIALQHPVYCRLIRRSFTVINDAPHPPYSRLQGHPYRVAFVIVGDFPAHCCLAALVLSLLLPLRTSDAAQKPIARSTELRYACTMKVLRVIRVPLPAKDYCGINEQRLGSQPPLIQEVQFMLMRGPEKSDIWYECTMDGCRGAGLESFPADAKEIPESIMEAMKIHAQMCEAVAGRLSKVP